MCPRMYMPVCGSNGKTYYNSCWRECQNAINGTVIEQAYEGCCKDDSDCVVGVKVEPKISSSNCSLKFRLMFLSTLCFFLYKFMINLK